MRKRTIRQPLTISFDLLLLLLLAGCTGEAFGDVISDVIGAVTSEAQAVVTQSDPVGLVPASLGGPSSDAFTMVGSTGQLNHHQTVQLVHLSWPQSHQAIESALGAPHTRDTYADYYQLPNGHTATIHYSGGNATGYSLGDSGE